MPSFLPPSGSYIHLTAYYALSLPEYHMHPHSHESCEIMYVTDGSCTVRCESETHTLHANQFILLAAGTPHSLEIGADGGCSILNLEFCLQDRPTPIPFQPLGSHSEEIRQLLKLDASFLIAEELRSLGYALKDLIGHLQHAGQPDDFLLCVLFYRAMLELSYCALHTRKNAGIAHLQRACRYIDDHLLDDLSVPDIAEHAGVCRSYLHALFSQLMHCTVSGYINRKRLEHAVFLLTNSSLSVTDIAFASGYNSRQHFALTFEKQYHTSPLRYRKLHSRTLHPDTVRAQYLLNEDGTHQGVQQLI